MAASDIVVTINGTDRTTFTNRYECTVEQNGDGTTDSCIVIVRGFTPTVGMEVKIVQGGTVTLFDGEITDLELIQRRTGTRQRYRCTCADWTFLLDRRLVTGSWLGTPADAIVASIIGSFTSGFTTTNVQSALLAVDFSAFLEPPSQVLQRLADAVGAVFKTLYSKDIYFRTTSNLSNPATLDTTNTTYKSFSYHQNIQQIRTRVYVTGAAVQTIALAVAGQAFLPLSGATYFAASGGSTLVGSIIATYTAALLNGRVPSPIIISSGTATSAGGSLAPSTAYEYGFAYTTAYGETTVGTTTIIVSTTGTNFTILVSNAQLSPIPPEAVGVNLYRRVSGSGLPFIAHGSTGTWNSTGQISFTDDGTHSATFAASLTSGSTAIGATTLAVTETIFAGAAGGLVIVNVGGIDYTITYTGRSTSSGAGNLTGIPATGPDSISVVIPTATAVSTAGLRQSTSTTTSGTATAGNTTIALTECRFMTHAGPGIATVVVQGITYTLSYAATSVVAGAGNLLGIPSTGPGSVTVSIPSGTAIVNVAGLTGIPTSGAGSITQQQVPAGTSAALFVQRDDATAQSVIAAKEGGDGIHEFPVTDGTLKTVSACNIYGDAELALGKQIVETSEFLSEDSAAMPGSSAVINIAGISTTIPIAHVSISWVAGRKNPQRQVTATTQYKTFSQYLAEIQAKALKAA